MWGLLERRRGLDHSIGHLNSLTPRCRHDSLQRELATRKLPRHP